MGNMLESDSGSQSEDNSEKEVRTEGDGMESGREDKSVARENVLGSPRKTKVFDSMSSASAGSSPTKILTPAVAFKNATLQLQKEVTEKTSPKQLPPRDQLINVKPSKLLEKSPPEINPLNMKPQNAKQKEPKFVPYEPYKGATRSMISEKPFTNHTRKESSSTISSVTSGKNSSAEVSPPADISLKNGPSLSSPKALLFQPPSSSELEQCSQHGHSILLLKERLRISDRDINELQKENSRLKRMLVDSMSGSPQTGENAQGSNGQNLRFNDTASESMDNLVDEIEVWRSKFLSSCVLVEQLSKQNQEWKDKVMSAAELFRETKQTQDVVLTPQLFHKINAWLHQDNISTYKPSCLYEQEDSLSPTRNPHHDPFIGTPE